MGKPETISAYLETAAEQVRWKRARPVVIRELEQHLTDQRDAFLEEGNDPETAERLAVEEMGDPVTVGTELDRVHRPKLQWGLLTMTLLLALAGGLLRVWLTADWAHQETDPERTLAALGLGTACLLGAYFLDYTFLGRHAKAVYIAAVAAGLLALWLSPNVNCASYYTRYVVLCYPVVYVLWLYAFHGKGWKGVLAVVLGGVPLACVCLAAPYTLGLFILLVSGLALLLAAARMDWFGVGKRPTAAAMLGIFTVLLLATFLLGNGSSFVRRLTYVFYPELDPIRYGYQGVVNRAALAGARWLGEGTMDPRYTLPYELTVPEAKQGMLPLTVIFKLGWLPFLLLLAVYAALMLWLLRRCLRQKSQLGRLVSLAVVLVLGIQVILSLLMNCGIVLWSAELPLLVGNLHTVLDMGLIGLALSVFRSSSIVREDSQGRVIHPNADQPVPIIMRES